MSLQRYQWSPTVSHDTPVRLQSLWPELPTVTQAREQAKVAIAYGASLFLFGLLLLALLPRQ
jgi:hypothetical protein